MEKAILDPILSQYRAAEPVIIIFFLTFAIFQNLVSLRLRMPLFYISRLYCYWFGTTLKKKLVLRLRLRLPAWVHDFQSTNMHSR